MYNHPVELVDLFPTLASLGNLSTPPAAYKLDGDNLVPGIISGGAVKRSNAAFGQITRCSNCTESYIEEKGSYRNGCKADSADAGKYVIRSAPFCFVLFHFVSLRFISLYLFVRVDSCFCGAPYAIAHREV